MTIFADHLPDRPGGRDPAQFLRLMSFLAPYKLRVTGAIVALLVAAGCVLALGQGLKHVIDHGFGQANAATLDAALGGVLALAVLLSVSTYARFYLMMSTGERVITDIRRAVFDHILALAPDYFESTRTGEVISRLTNDTTVLQAVIGFGFSLAVRNALLLVGALGLLLMTNLKLTLIVLAFAPLVVLPVIAVGRRVRRTSRVSQDRVADVSAFIDEALHEIRTVQAYVHEDESRREFGRLAENAYEAGVRRVGLRAMMVGVVMLVVFGAVGVILWIGGRDVLGGQLSAGELSAFIFYCAIAAGATGAISEVLSDLQRAAGATERLFELLDTRPTIEGSAAAPAWLAAAGARMRGEIEVREVSFAYPARPDTNALERFSLTLAPGERVAVVGPSGAGKSTLLALLLRFYDPQAGSIRLDGIELRELDPQLLRGQIAVVPQDPVIFAASVLENVRFGRPAASRGEVERACDAAYASEFVARLPQGLDTQLGERGVTLSGGQRQRLSIARALLADRPVLLLDEATSSLDAASERMVQQALEALERGRTTLVIAHRFATVQHADRIVVMDRGTIVAQGTHAQLVAEGGLYAKLAALQFLGAEEPAGLERAA